LNENGFIRRAGADEDRGVADFGRRPAEHAASIYISAGRDAPDRRALPAPVGEYSYRFGRRMLSILCTATIIGLSRIGAGTVASNTLTTARSSTMRLLSMCTRKMGGRPGTHRFGTFLLIGIAALVCNACLDQQEPAKQSLDEISNVLTTASADAAKYAPEQMADVQRELADLKISYDRKGYGDVIAHAPSVLADAKNLVADAAAKKEDVAKALNRQWSGFEASLPPRISAVTTRVGQLSRTQRSAKGMDLAAARSALADATEEWAHAQAAFGGGKVEEAIATAKDAQSKTDTAATTLGLELPANVGPSSPH